MLTIAAREFNALFRTPSAWIIAAVLQVFFAWYFLSTLEQYLAVQDKLSLQDHAPGITAFVTFRYLAPCSALLLLICPLLTMRTYADEYRQGTFTLLQIAPVSTTSIVAGKFLGVYAFVAVLLSLAMVMPLCLSFITTVDFATLAWSFAGLLSVAALCTSVGLLFSSLTRHTLVAAIASSTLLVILWVIGKHAVTSPLVQQALHTLATSSHLGSFFQGLISSRDIVYFALLCGLFLGLTIIRLGHLGWQSNLGR